ncbi:MAG: hypothetical protein OEU92_31375, partial [Alphaproteobacteria bacterium]|nr:hypothetical protein [Alphaproteobacteria bacterium]
LTSGSPQSTESRKRLSPPEPNLSVLTASRELGHERIAAEKKRLRQFLEAQRQDIEANDDPKIRRFRKKRKIIVHPDAAKDLL